MSLCEQSSFDKAADQLQETNACDKSEILSLFQICLCSKFQSVSHVFTNTTTSSQTPEADHQKIAGKGVLFKLKHSLKGQPIHCQLFNPS